MAKLKVNDFFSTESNQGSNFGFIQDIQFLNSEEIYWVSWKNFPNQVFSYKVKDVDHVWDRTSITFKVDHKTSMEKVQKDSYQEKCLHQGSMKFCKGFFRDYNYCEKCNYKNYDV